MGFALEPRFSKVLGDVTRANDHRRAVFAFSPCEVERCRSAKAGDFSIELPYAGFACVVPNDGLEDGVVEVELAAIEPVALRSLRQEVSASDLDFLFGCVPRELDHLEAVAERCGERLESVRRAEEEHLREVERNLEVVIGERVVLLRVQDLEERRFRRSLETLRELVDLVEQDHRVFDLGLSERVQDASRQCAHVGAPVAANLGFVAHAAKRDTNERAARGLRDRLPEASLSDARRSHEAK